MPRSSSQLAAILVLAAGATSPSRADSTIDRVHHALDVELPRRFANADANHDGRLTRAEARSGMPRVYANFDRIDTAGRGYVTEQDIRHAVETQLLPMLEKGP